MSWQALAVGRFACASISSDRAVLTEEQLRE